jgi:hypothetical protein
MRVISIVSFSFSSIILIIVIGKIFAPARIIVLCVAIVCRKLFLRARLSLSPRSQSLLLF